ncbi:hypothetical protein BCD67_24320 [Oscillatoriales cyanobacterium USR001]|nr:hypothetical protein BCD67_24320 [Oscillatoriales cyanobacterium USR001]
MIKKNAEIDAIEKAQEDIDNQSILNLRIVQSQPESVAIIPNKKVKKISLILWLTITSGMLFGIFKLISELVKNYQFDNVQMAALPCMGYKPKNGELPEAKQYVGSMNRAQQVKFAENRVFANSVDELGLGMKTETSSVRYSVKTTNKTAFHYGLSKDEKFKSYVGAVFLVTNNHTKETSTTAISCVTKSPTKTQPPNPILNNGNPTCANGTDPVTR